MNPNNPMIQALEFPLELSFKLVTLSNQIYVRDAAGKEIAYVRQKLFRLKELIKVFPNQTATAQTYEIQADRVLDFSGNYRITDATGQEIGSVQQQGMRSLWRAKFVVSRNGQEVARITEKSVLTRFLDLVVGNLPFVGVVSSYIFQPSYLVENPQGQLLLEMAKQAAFFEGVFKVEQQQAVSVADQQLLVMALIMVVLLERSRG
jgi:uncharacterized protein YxjI